MSSKDESAHIHWLDNNYLKWEIYNEKTKIMCIIVLHIYKLFLQTALQNIALLIFIWKG